MAGLKHRMVRRRVSAEPADRLAPVTIISSAGCVIGQMLLISQKPPFEGPLPALTCR
jgi:hypothetical protein